MRTIGLALVFVHPTFAATGQRLHTSRSSGKTESLTIMDKPPMVLTNLAYLLVALKSPDAFQPYHTCLRRAIGSPPSSHAHRLQVAPVMSSFLPYHRSLK